MKVIRNGGWPREWIQKNAWKVHVLLTRRWPLYDWRTWIYSVIGIEHRGGVGSESLRTLLQWFLRGEKQTQYFQKCTCSSHSVLIFSPQETCPRRVKFPGTLSNVMSIAVFWLRRSQGTMEPRHLGESMSSTSTLQSYRQSLAFCVHPSLLQICTLPLPSFFASLISPFHFTNFIFLNLTLL